MANEKNSAEFHGKHHVKSDKDGNMLIQDEKHRMVAATEAQQASLKLIPLTKAPGKIARAQQASLKLIPLIKAPGKIARALWR